MEAHVGGLGQLVAVIELHRVAVTEVEHAAVTEVEHAAVTDFDCVTGLDGGQTAIEVVGSRGDPGQSVFDLCPDILGHHPPPEVNGTDVNAWSGTYLDVSDQRRTGPDRRRLHHPPLCLTDVLMGEDVNLTRPGTHGTIPEGPEGAWEPQEPQLKPLARMRTEQGMESEFEVTEAVAGPQLVRMIVQPP